MEARFLVAIALCVLIYLLFQPFVAPPPPAVGPAAGPEAGQQDAADNSDRDDSPTDRTTDPSSRDEVLDPSSAEAPRGADLAARATFPVYPQQTVDLQNDLLRVSIDSVGARITGIVLQTYQEDDFTSPLVIASEALDSGSMFSMTGLHRLGERSWRVVEKSANEVRLEAEIPDGVVEKRIALSAERSYQVDIELRFPTGLADPVDYRFNLARTVHYDGGGGGRDPENERVLARKREGVYEVDHDTVSSFEEPTDDRVQWAGLASNFFALVCHPVSDKPIELSSTPMPTGDPQKRREDDKKQGIPLALEFERTAEPGAVHRYEIFAGPKNRKVLEEYAAIGLPDLVSYGGPLAPLVRLFLWMFSAFHSFTGSYGIAIIFLTFLVKLLLHPVNKRNQSMMQRQQKKMAKLQPDMERVKKQYKNDRMRQQQEMQQLFRDHQVNPLAMAGGCLLMFLQLPIWIGLIQTFKVAIELRHESFLFIEDLMRPDRLFSLPFDMWLFGSSFNLLPLLYVVLTLVNQRLMPKPANEQMAQQQKLMTFMLVGFGVFFYQFPSGLLLYFMTSAGLGIIEQRIIRAELRREGLGDTPTPTPSKA